MKKMKIAIVIFAAASVIYIIAGLIDTGSYTAKATYITSLWVSLITVPIAALSVWLIKWRFTPLVAAALCFGAFLYNAVITDFAKYGYDIPDTPLVAMTVLCVVLFFISRNPSTNKCYKCSTKIVYENGLELARKYGITDTVVMCEVCKSVYSAVCGKKMSLGANVTKDYKEQIENAQKDE
jgi:hypothetical protein